MVNLPPDQPTPSAPTHSADAPPSRGNRILDFDELLAVVLAFLGIGSILWWGLSRNQELWTGFAPLQRREPVGAIAEPEVEPPEGLFVPRTVEPRPGLRPVPPGQPLPGRTGGFLGLGPARRPILVPGRQQAQPVPAAPATVPDAPQGAATQPLDISDVPPTHWAYPFIRPMFDQGYLPDFPEGGFQPDQPLSRAELAALLSQAFGNDAAAESNFSDVPENYWAAAAIDRAVAQDFMSGYPEGDFRPDQAVPRYEVIVSLVSGLGLEPPPAPEQSLQPFIDFNAMPEWAIPQVAAAADNNLLVNYPARDQIKPAQAATRAEIVAMIHQALVQRGELPTVESEYTVP
ncbi:S-layer homology domain-containing protein [Leptolyngbya sp. KIOST-1]|uniref:S-layer homology domain-containing protein n=1 Tax=Leptolyngbya sp. KIOST-1 TaxID=1229172 RepID=UPI000691B2AE|nr:S-layer homology domain-containing protein [Leptolyngbya sp. KIOST-1]